MTFKMVRLAEPCFFERFSAVRRYFMKKKRRKLIKTRKRRAEKLLVKRIKKRL